MNPKKERFWEIDSLRGIAIISMIIIHIFYDLMYFHEIAGEIGSGILGILSFFTATAFLMLVGISFTISYEKAAEEKKSFSKTYPKYIKRGLFILAGGFLITLVSMILLPGGFIVFGILHLIGVSILLAPFFYKFRSSSLYIGIFFIAIGLLLASMNGPYFLLPIGIHPADFYSYDYEPLFPWFGAVLIGMHFGSIFYPKGKRAFLLETKPGKLLSFLSFLGRNSLLIYFLHQPVLIMLISLLH